MLTALAYLGFVGLGLPDGLLGIAWPSIRATFGLPIDALGALLVMFTAGYLAWWVSTRRWPSPLRSRRSASSPSSSPDSA